MDTVRDLGRIDPWQESLERALARRAQRRPAADRRQTRARAARRRRVGVVAIFALALPIVVLLSPLAGRGTEGSSISAQARDMPVLAHARYAALGGAGPLSRWWLPKVVATGLTRACQPTSRPGDYVNPLAGARVRPERVDQGVDYAGSGTLAAIGGGTVTSVATTATGWPGSFIEYRLIDGPDAGCYVYYAEGVNPAAGLRVGQTVAAGEPIASIVPRWSTGIELGWGAGISTATYAAETHQWSASSDQNSVASAAGKSFSALIASLGGPPGRVEG